MACMFPTENALLQWWAARSAWVSLSYLTMGMLLLVLNRTRLMLVCLGCSAAVSFFAIEKAQRRLEPNAKTQPVFKFVCLYKPDAQAQEIAGILLERGIDAVFLIDKPGNTDSALLETLVHYWPNRFDAPVGPEDTLQMHFYTRLPVATGTDTMRFDSSGGIWISLYPEFAWENMWVYIAGEGRSEQSEVQSPKFEDSLGMAPLRTSDFRLQCLPGPSLHSGTNKVPPCVCAQALPVCKTATGARKSIKKGLNTRLFSAHTILPTSIACSRKCSDLPAGNTSALKASYA